MNDVKIVFLLYFLACALSFSSIGKVHASEVRRPAEGPALRALRAENQRDHARLLASEGFSSAPVPGESAAALHIDDPCREAIKQAEKEKGIPNGLLASIAQVESSRLDALGRRRPWPWTVDIDGVGHFFANRKQAVDSTRQALNRGASAVDVGCLQVDLEQHPDAFQTLEEGFDPVINSQYAAQFLYRLKARSHDWTRAVGFYHSKTAALATSYRKLVAAASNMRPNP
ncbi:transglycosylase SLT domain-containing protein [Acidisoma sp. L85]|uniref:transglycosylase SLT domain-containing protein n=1 Tax=Acidisoma sp. L85 TaxID=1641850 RepID=UPI00131C4B77|nr:transglycosylase SLT domain-containing protein [Acidisoma sp. L85]